MSKHEKLANYLATGMKDYAQGVAIFKQLDIDRKANDFFDVEKPSALQINLLKKKLSNHARVNKIKPAVKTAKADKTVKSEGKKDATSETETTDTKKEKPMIDTNPVVRFEDLPEEYQLKFKRTGDLSNQQKTLHVELKALKGKEDDDSKQKRAELSQDIVNIKNEVKEIWAEIDAWWNANKDKTKEQQIADNAATSAIEKEKRIKANRTYIQRSYGNEKKKDEVTKRMKELDEWGIDYAEDIKKAGEPKAPKK